MTGVRILIVEDEFLIRITLSEALSDAGFEVEEAASGDEALTLIDATPGIALLLTDVQLPGSLDGLALARTARERAPDLPVIFMSGRPDCMTAADLSERDMVVPKPYRLADICAAARRLTTA